MYSLNDLEEMQQIDIKRVDPDNIADLRELTINPEQPVPDRIRSYMEAVQNPFLVKVNNYVVKLEYSDCEETLKDRMKQYLSKLTDGR